ncbi:MAG: hypothetical protein U0136_17595 [Bdellovibrionota bacterium]
MEKTQVDKNEALRNLVRRAIKRRRRIIVYEIARRCQELMSEHKVGGVMSATSADEWIRIESLSGLRALVGGRFQNLKDKWVRAGFPLREHRGDRAGQKNIDYQGWIELAAWINKQGFELKLAEEDQPWLFELKKQNGGAGD